MDRLFFVSSQLNVFKTNQFFEVIVLLAMDWQPEKKHKVPLYKQIVSYIKNKITAGEWPAGTKLPPQRTLSQFFQVNRSTLNTALDELTADGFIDYDEVLDPRVVDHEPHLALFADDHGYACYENIFKQAPSILKEKAILAFEIGYNQGERMKHLVPLYFPDDTFEVIKDINGKDRMLFIYHNYENI